MNYCNLGFEGNCYIEGDIEYRVDECVCTH